MNHTQTPLPAGMTAAAQLLLRPGTFFAAWGQGAGTIRQPAVFLIITAGLFALASLVIIPAAASMQSWGLLGAILFVNAIGMTGLAALIGYIVVTMLLGRPIPFSRLFGIYAFAAGITLLFSWVPAFLWLTEPWKWWLIYTGLTVAGALRRGQALLVVGLSVGMMLLLFWSVINIIGPA